MFTLIKIWRELKRYGIMGINKRNADFVLRYNNRRNFPLVDDKTITKKLALKAGMSVPDLYGVISSEHDIKTKLKGILDGRNDFVIKPAQGSGGDGIVVVADRFDEYRFKTVSGRLITYSEIEYHISGILTGLYSLGGARDKAIIEYRVAPDPVFKSISYDGVPDVRVIVLQGYPVMGMLRLPTRQSGGKANLHQGAIGVGINLIEGKTLNGSWLNEQIVCHPDTGNSVSGIDIPYWNEIITLAASAYEMVNLGYIGVDIVIDKDKGPLILELNARPGLNIQLANDLGLCIRTSAVEKHIEELEGGCENVENRLHFIRNTYK